MRLWKVCRIAYPTLAYSLVTLLSCTCPTDAYMLALRDEVSAFPYLHNALTNKRISWKDGYSLELLTTCRFVRITRRGIRCIPPSMDPINGWEDGWLSLHCQPDADSLCRSTRDGGKQRIFPSDETVYVSEPYMDVCSNGQGRIVTHKDGKNDTSLCDLVDGNRDIVFDPTTNHLYWKDLGEAGWLYIVSSFLILVIVILICESLVKPDHEAQSEEKQITTSKNQSTTKVRTKVEETDATSLLHNLVATSLLLIASIMMLANADQRFHTLITSQDQLVFIATLVYILCCGGIWVWFLVTKSTTTLPQSQRHGLNCMISGVYFAVSVMYGSSDHIYSIGFFFLLVFRVLQKMFETLSSENQWEIHVICSKIMIMFDILFLLIVYTFGFSLQFHNAGDSLLYAATLFTVAFVIALYWSRASAS